MVFENSFQIYLVFFITLYIKEIGIAIAFEDMPRSRATTYISINYSILYRKIEIS